MSKVFLKWINLFLREDIDSSNSVLLISKILSKTVEHLLCNIETKKDLFERQQISSIIEILQLVISFYGDEQGGLNKLLRFIFNICRDIPELEYLNQNLSPEDQIHLETELNLPPDQVIKLNFSKYELLQLIEHIEQKYSDSIEKIRNLHEVIKQQQQDVEDSEHTLETYKIEQQKKLELLQSELDKNNEQQKLDKIQFEELNSEYYKISQENSQLLSYLQSVIQEQEIQIQEYLKFQGFPVRNQTQQEKINNLDTTMMEQQIMLYTQKLQELHQTTQMQRRDIIKLEIDKSICEQKFKGALESKEIDNQKLKEELDTLKSQISQINETSTRSKNLSSHTTSSKCILAQELQESQINQQRLKESIILDENIQLRNIIKGLQIKNQEERECYQRNIEKFLTDLDEEKKKQESDQLFLKQLQIQNQQISAHNRTKSENIKSKAQQKKLEQQVELLKQIIDVCLQQNQQF